MERKTYHLMTNLPLTGFEKDVLNMLQEIADSGFEPKAAVFAALDSDGNVGTFYHNANLSDMILMRGFIDLDIQADYLGINAPELPEDYEEDDEEEGG